MISSHFLFHRNPIFDYLLLMISFQYILVFNRIISIFGYSLCVLYTYLSFSVQIEVFEYECVLFWEWCNGVEIFNLCSTHCASYSYLIPENKFDPCHEKNPFCALLSV